MTFCSQGDFFIFLTKSKSKKKKHIRMLYISNSAPASWLTHQHTAKVPLSQIAHINMDKDNKWQVHSDTCESQWINMMHVKRDC